jgi:hypothetical protein
MLELAVSAYDGVKYLLADIPFNTLFARAVADKKVHGSIYVDDPEKPLTALFCHPYGLLLLCGDTDNPVFNRGLHDFMLNNNSSQPLWLQVYPESWCNQIESLLKNRLLKYDRLRNTNMEKEIGQLKRNYIVERTRVNFVFKQNKYLNLKKTKLPEGFKIHRLDEYLFSGISGQVIPKYFWNSAYDFLKNGVGFCLLKDNTIISTCFSAFLSAGQLELGVETNAAFRDKGYAVFACRALIDYCLKNNYEPVWACMKENIGSYKLALKLGFEIKAQFPYYGLIKKE